MKTKTISSIDVLPILEVDCVNGNVTSTEPVLVRILGELWRVDEKGTHRRGVFAEGVRSRRRQEAKRAAKVGGLVEMLGVLSLVR